MNRTIQTVIDKWRTEHDIPNEAVTDLEEGYLGYEMGLNYRYIDKRIFDPNIDGELSRLRRELTVPGFTTHTSAHNRDFDSITVNWRDTARQHAKNPELILNYDMPHLFGDELIYKFLVSLGSDESEFGRLIGLGHEFAKALKFELPPWLTLKRFAKIYETGGLDTDDVDDLTFYFTEAVDRIRCADHYDRQNRDLLRRAQPKLIEYVVAQVSRLVGQRKDL